MKAGLIRRTETGMNFTASALLGGAVGFAVYGWLGVALPQPQLAAGMAAAGLTTFLLCNRGWGAASRREPEFALSIFDVREIETFMSDNALFLTDADRLDPSELLLTDADRLEPSELLLTDADRIGST